MRAPRVSPRAQTRLALINVGLLVAIVVSGAIVRLTNSGLGCADWPNCSATRLVDVSSHHAAIEQVNRIFSGLLFVPLALGLLAAYWRVPRRRDLVTLGWLLVALFASEAIVGGIAVKVKLTWVSVSGHFLLAIALLAVALVIHRRAAESSTKYRVVVSRGVLSLVRAVYAGAIWVLLLGTLVTAAGPHGGDPTATRLDVPLVDLARAHGASVDVLVLAVAVLVVVLVRMRAPGRVLAAASATVAAMMAQGILGYVQYAKAIPAVLVGFHVFGAAIVFVCVQQMLLETRVALAEAHRGSDGSGTDGASEPRHDVARVDTGARVADVRNAFELAEDRTLRLGGKRAP
jgi:cytochrome c oxidase assembly protein subunit 15